MRTSLIDMDTLSHNWGAVALRGAAAIAFGFVTMLAPGISLVALVAVFGAFALVDGVLALLSAFRPRSRSGPWWALALEGLAGIGIGVLTFAWPGITAMAMLYMIAAWALIKGVLEIAAAIRLRKAIKGEWLLALSGLASIILGGVLMMFPGPGAVALVLWIGVYALVAGVLLLTLAFRLRSWKDVREPQPYHASAGTTQTGHRHGHVTTR